MILLNSAVRRTELIEMSAGKVGSAWPDEGLWCHGRAMSVGPGLVHLLGSSSVSRNIDHFRAIGAATGSAPRR
jgi:hypothetical protein